MNTEPVGGDQLTVGGNVPNKEKLNEFGVHVLEWALAHEIVKLRKNVECLREIIADGKAIVVASEDASERIRAGQKALVVVGTERGMVASEAILEGVE